MKKAVALQISGRVQNVGFRYNTRKMAEEFQIAGFVKNRPDGSVYAEAAGEEENLDQFILWCHKGPTWARVDKVNIQDIPHQDFDGFSVR